MLNGNVLLFWGLVLAGGLLIAVVVKSTIQRPRCAYCRARLKPDATVCSSCGRAQP